MMTAAPSCEVSTRVSAPTVSVSFTPPETFRLGGPDGTPWGPAAIGNGASQAFEITGPPGSCFSLFEFRLLDKNKDLVGLLAKPGEPAVDGVTVSTDLQSAENSVGFTVVNGLDLPDGGFVQFFLAVQADRGQVRTIVDPQIPLEGGG